MSCIKQKPRLERGLETWYDESVSFSCALFRDGIVSPFLLIFVMQDPLRESVLERPERQLPEKEETVLGSFFELVKVFLFAAVIIIPVKVFLFQPFFVQGSSMEPNFSDGDYLIVSEFGYKTTEVRLGDNLHFSVDAFRDPKRLDVVVFRYPKDPSTYFIKRVIGLPGETVEIKNSKVFIYNTEHPSGFQIDEGAFLPRGVVTPETLKVTLREGEFFVLGDNRQASYDSRSIGPIDETKIIGRVGIRIWPFSALGLH